MSVPSWKRSESKSEYINLLNELNVRLIQIVMNKPKKYRGNCSDKLINAGMDALKYAQIANGIYMTRGTDEDEFRLRKSCLLKARGLAEHTATASRVFLDAIKRIDGEDKKKLYQEQEYIGDTCKEIYKKISGVLKSDKALMRKK